MTMNFLNVGFFTLFLNSLGIGVNSFNIIDYTIENILTEYDPLKSIDFDMLMPCNNISGHLYLGVPVILSPIFGKSLSSQIFVVTSFRDDSRIIVLKSCNISSTQHNTSTNRVVFETADPISIHISIFQRRVMKIPVSALIKLAQKLQEFGLHLQIPSWPNEALNYVGRSDQKLNQLAVEFKDRIDGINFNENRYIVYSNIFELDDSCQSVTRSQSIPVGYLIEQEYNEQINRKLSCAFIGGYSSETIERTIATNNSIGIYTKSQIETRIREAESLAETIHTLKALPIKVPNTALPNAVESARKSRRVWENTLENFSKQLEHQSAVTMAVVGEIISSAATLGVHNLFISGSRFIIDNRRIQYLIFTPDLPVKLIAVKKQISTIREILHTLSSDTEVIVKGFTSRYTDNNYLLENFLNFINLMDDSMKKRYYQSTNNKFQLMLHQFRELSSGLGNVALVELWMSMCRDLYSKGLRDALTKQMLLEFLVSVEREDIVMTSRQLASKYGLGALEWSLRKAGYAATVTLSKDKTESGVMIDLWEPSFGNTAGHEEYLMFMKDNLDDDLDYYFVDES
eukprot:gene2911-5712_t